MLMNLIGLAIGRLTSPAKDLERMGYLCADSQALNVARSVTRFVLRTDSTLARTLGQLVRGPRELQAVGLCDLVGRYRPVCEVVGGLQVL